MKVKQQKGYSELQELLKTKNKQFKNKQNGKNF